MEKFIFCAVWFSYVTLRLPDFDIPQPISILV